MAFINYCEHCLKKVGCHVKEIEETFPVKGQDIKLLSSVAVCENCDNPVFDEELDSMNLEKAYEIYRKENNILSPVDIKAVRNMYGLSQKSFSRLLGFGEITIHRYEAGGIPDEAHNLALTMIKDYSNMEKLLQKYAGRITENELKRVKESIRNVKLDKQENIYKDIEQNIFIKPESIMNGFRRYAHDRFAHMVQFFAKKDSDYLWKTKLLKLLWYSDFYHFKKYSISISGLEYARLPYGPCPDDYEILFGILTRTKVVDAALKIVGDYEGEAFVFDDQVIEHESLASEEIETLEKIWNTFKGFSAADIAKKSHLEKAWKSVKQGHLIPYSYAMDLSL